MGFINPVNACELGRTFSPGFERRPFAATDVAGTATREYGASENVLGTVYVPVAHRVDGEARTGAMMPRLSRRRGTAEGGPGVPEEFRDALDQVLKSEWAEGSLAADLRDFVLTGAPSSVLTRVSGTSAPFHPMLVWGAPSRRSAAQDTLRRFYIAVNDVAADVAIRWARLVEACGSRAHMLSTRPFAGVRWAEALLDHVAVVFSVDDEDSATSIPLSHGTLERMLVAAGAAPSALLVEGFRSPSGPRYLINRPVPTLRRLAGYDDAVLRYAEVLRPVVAAPKAEARLVALKMLAPTSPETLRLFATELAELATSTSSQVRVAAAPLLDRCGDAAIAPLRRLVEDGKPEVRLHALRLLWSTEDPDIRAWARERANADRAASVRSLRGEWANQEAAERSTAAFEVPPTPRIDWTVPITDDIRDLLGRIADDINGAIDKRNATVRARAEQVEARSGHRPHWLKPEKRLPGGWSAAIAAEFNAGRPPQVKAGAGKRTFVPHLVEAIIERHARNPSLGPVALTILLNELSQLTAHGRLSDAAAAAYNALHEASGRPTLLELSTMLDAMGVDGGRAVFLSYCRDYGEPIGRDWPDHDVAPFVATHRDLVSGFLTAAGEADHRYWTDVAAPYRALATLPTQPADVVDTLFALALGSRKTLRRPAQDALARVPRFPERIVTALSDGKAEVRTLAAQWLGRAGHALAVPALEATVGKERNDIAKGAMLDALEALGRPVEKYLDRAALETQVASALRKGLPKQLDWLRWESLPPVRWADSGDAVPTEVVRWFVAQAVRAKSPEPGALLRKYCAMLEPRGREELGQFLLETWIAEDLRPIDPDLARQLAEERAHNMRHWMSRSPQYFKDDPLFGASVEELTAAYLPEFERMPAGSATASKGMLAVVAACAGKRATPVVDRYLKEWYGYRAAQGKALIAMLAWIEDPSATQLMLSVGSRFRTKSFQEEATRQAQALAERRGWSMAELADRTIPTCGFDQTGTLDLSYGDRVFAATLQPDLTIAVRSPQGKAIRSLPQPRVSDDETRAKEAKKALTAAKKELRSAARLQTERLYEALCTQRTWAFDDWQRYLNGHPLMRHLTRRLAWVATGSSESRVFRPLDDGTLTDVDDEEVTIAADAVVAVAHDTNLDPAAVHAWRQHFDDYEVAPLFQQFGKGRFELSADKSNDREDTDFRGHLIEAYALRGRATKLGYTRGATGDGGWFHTYEKRFPTLGLSTVVEFSGNGLPEENRTVALTGLRFVKHGPSGSGTAPRLAEVPAVLRSEAYADMRLIAADGTGHAPDWEKKVEY